MKEQYHDGLQPLDIGDILNSLRQKYLHCASYCDEGTVTTTPPNGKGTPIEFRTYFERPHKTRFEWRRWHPHQERTDPSTDSVIWSNGTQTHSWFLGEKRDTTLPSAIAAATGVSSASVLQILKLLMPECVETRRCWYEMQNVMFKDDERVDGALCYHLVGDSKGISDVEAWIDKDDMLVRRLRNHKRISAKELVKIREKATEIERKMALPADVVTTELAMPQVDRIYYYEYNYASITINQAIAGKMFTEHIPET